MLGIARPWSLKTERGPGCLFVRIESESRSPASGEELVELLRAQLDQHFVNRLILECDALTSLPAGFRDQLATFAEQLSADGGQLRLTGLRPNLCSALEPTDCDNCLPMFVDRAHALMGRHTH